MCRVKALGKCGKGLKMRSNVSVADHETMAVVRKRKGTQERKDKLG